MAARIVKILSMLLRVLQLILALFIVGVASFHVYQFSKNHLTVTNGRSGQLPHALYAVEVISCFAALFTLLALLTTCLGHRKFFLLVIILDLLLLGGFIAVSILLRGSAHQTCRNVLWNPSISKRTNNLPASFFANTGSDTSIITNTDNTTGANTRASPRLLCDLDKACFALAIALAVLFLITMVLSYFALRSYQKHRAFGPGPANGYGARSGAHKPFTRASEETAYTNNTAMTGTTAGYDAPGFRGSTAARAEPEYRAPATTEMPGSGRFDPALPHSAVDPRYEERGYGNQNF